MEQYNPRIQLKKRFAEGELKPEDPTTMSSFAKEFIVGEEIVKAALDDMLYRDITKEARKRESRQRRQIEQNQSCDDIPWLEKVENGSIRQLLVKTLDKYLLKYNLTGCLKLKSLKRLLLFLDMLLPKDYMVQSKTNKWKRNQKWWRICKIYYLSILRSLCTEQKLS